MYRTLFYKVSKKFGKGSTVFRALIEGPEEHDYHMQVFDELTNSDYDCEITPVKFDNKIYDFFFHDTLKDAQSFCETLGYEIILNSPNQAVWKRKLFSVK